MIKSRAPTSGGSVLLDLFDSILGKNRNEINGPRSAGSDWAECGLVRSEVTAAVMKMSQMRPAAGGVSRRRDTFKKKMQRIISNRTSVIRQKTIL